MMSGEELAGDEKGPNITESNLKTKRILCSKDRYAGKRLTTARNKHVLASPDP